MRSCGGINSNYSTRKINEIWNLRSRFELSVACYLIVILDGTWEQRDYETVNCTRLVDGWNAVDKVSCMTIAAAYCVLVIQSQSRN